MKCINDETSDSILWERAASAFVEFNETLPRIHLGKFRIEFYPFAPASFRERQVDVGRFFDPERSIKVKRGETIFHGPG